MNATNDDPVLTCLDELDEALGLGDLRAARDALARARQVAAEDDPDVAFAHARLVWEERGAAHARPILEQLVARDPEHADAHYALAAAAEERDDAAAMVAHNLRVLALDAAQDRDAALGTRAQLDRLEATARRVLAELPEPFASKLAHVPVVLEARPARHLVEDGFDPRALGLFEGQPHGSSDLPVATRIVLFTHNLLADFDEGPELDEEIEVTILHEVGHFFGLDEADMERLGLD